MVKLMNTQKNKIYNLKLIVIFSVATGDKNVTMRKYNHNNNIED